MSEIAIEVLRERLYQAKAEAECGGEVGEAKTEERESDANNSL